MVEIRAAHGLCLFLALNIVCNGLWASMAAQSATSFSAIGARVAGACGGTVQLAGTFGMLQERAFILLCFLMPPKRCH